MATEEITIPVLKKQKAVLREEKRENLSKDRNSPKGVKVGKRVRSYY